MSRVRVRALGFVLSVFAAASWAGPLCFARSEVERQIRFGTEMAQQGNWQEALFRWRRALTADPSNARLHNNLAVAYESLGQFDKADAEYRAAVAAADAPSEIRLNYDLFLKFYDRYREGAAAPSPQDQPSKPPNPDAGTR